jgi:hypothetical protein
MSQIQNIVVVEDFFGTGKVLNADDLISVLKRRNSEDANEVWLSYEGRPYPSLSVLVVNGLACVQYFPTAGHPGYISMPDAPVLQEAGTTVFYINGGHEEQEIQNECVVRLEDAVIATTEFLKSSSLPLSIQWFEL